MQIAKAAILVMLESVLSVIESVAATIALITHWQQLQCRFLSSETAVAILIAAETAKTSKAAILAVLEIVSAVVSAKFSLLYAKDLYNKHE